MRRLRKLQRQRLRLRERSLRKAFVIDTAAIVAAGTKLLKEWGLW